MVSVGGGKSGPLQVRAQRPNPDVISARLGEEIVLFHLRTDRFYELNGTAASFWELLCFLSGLANLPAILDAIEQALGENALLAGRVRKPC